MNNAPSDSEKAQEVEAMLTQVEARVLGCLMEKQMTTPNTYPLTLNSLVLACNQKTSREPIMTLDPGEVGHTANVLQQRKFISILNYGRVEKYDQRLAKHFDLDKKEQAVLCVLLLRSSQTLNELRTRTQRMVNFLSLDEVANTLEMLMAREPPLVIKQPRSAGRREDRYAHLLCGEIDLEEPASPVPQVASITQQRIAELEIQVAQLRSELNHLWQLTGLADQRSDVPEDESQT